MKIKTFFKLSFLGILLFFMKYSFSWNAVGHRIVVEIAMHHLTTHAKHTFTMYNQAFDDDPKYQDLVNASTWLDDLRHQEVNEFNTIHYYDFPFSVDGTPLPAIPIVNAVWAINEAIHKLANPKAEDKDKGLALRILLHVVGDIHQPLHAVTRVSRQHPKGDLGGNLFLLGETPVAPNLHSYWDQGGGFLSEYYTRQQFESLVAEIERKWPCRKTSEVKNPAKAWAIESHHIAVEMAYQLENNETPSDNYQHTARLITEERLALAGCRLATLLNAIDQKT